MERLLSRQDTFCYYRGFSHVWQTAISDLNHIHLQPENEDPAPKIHALSQSIRRKTAKGDSMGFPPSVDPAFSHYICHRKEQACLQKNKSTFLQECLGAALFPSLI